MKSHRRHSTTTSRSDRALKLSKLVWPRPILIVHAHVSVTLLFRGFNFRGSTVIRENRENRIPRKFPAIRYVASRPSLLMESTDYDSKIILFNIIIYLTLFFPDVYRPLFLQKFNKKRWTHNEMNNSISLEVCNLANLYIINYFQSSSMYCFNQIYVTLSPYL